MTRSKLRLRRPPSKHARDHVRGLICKLCPSEAVVYLPPSRKAYKASSKTALNTKCAFGCELGGVYGAQEFHELITDQVRGFVLYPVANIVQFEPPNETRKAGAHLVHGKRIEFFESISFSPNVKGGLSDLRAFESGGQIEIRFGGTVVVQAAVKAGALKFRHVMIDVI